MSPHRCKLQISIVIGHVVKHVGHGNHHRWVGGCLLLSLIIVIIIVVLLFLWLLETTEDRGGTGSGWTKAITGEFRRTSRKRRSGHFTCASVCCLRLTDL